MKLKTRWYLILLFGTRFGIDKCGKINWLNSVSDNCTGISVNSGFSAIALINQWPLLKNSKFDYRIRFLQTLQWIRPVCKTRNQFIEIYLRVRFNAAFAQP